MSLHLQPVPGAAAPAPSTPLASTIDDVQTAGDGVFIVFLRPDVPSAFVVSAFEDVARVSGLHCRGHFMGSNSMTAVCPSPKLSCVMETGVHATKGNCVIVKFKKDRQLMTALGVAAAVGGTVALVAAAGAADPDRKHDRHVHVHHHESALGAVRGVMDTACVASMAYNVNKNSPATEQSLPFPHFVLRFQSLFTEALRTASATAPPTNKTPIDASATALATGHAVAFCVSFQRSEMFYVDVEPVDTREGQTITILIESTHSIGVRASHNRRPNWLMYDIKEVGRPAVSGHKYATVIETGANDARCGRWYVGVWGNSVRGSSDVRLTIRVSGTPQHEAHCPADDDDDEWLVVDEAPACSAASAPDDRVLGSAGAGGGGSSAPGPRQVDQPIASIAPPPYREFEGVPHELMCPITGDVFVDPVVAADGHSYERSAIEEWFRRSDEQGGRRLFGQNECRSPMTGAALENRTLIPNHHLKSQCAEYRQ